MKTILSLMLAFIMAFTFSSNVSAQNYDYNSPTFASYGDTVEEREENAKKYSFLRDAYTMKDYDDYMKRFEDLVVARPTAQVNMYIMGVRLNKIKLAEATDEAEREKYINHIVRMYNLQAEHFGVNNGKDTSPSIYTNVMSLYLSEDFAKYQDSIINVAHKIVDKSKDYLSIDFVALYFGSLTAKFLYDELAPDVVLAEFDYLSDAMDKSVNPDKGQIQSNLDAMLLNSQAADCDNLEVMFRAKYEKDPNNLDLIKKIMRYLNNGNCEGEFKTLLSEKYYKLDPSADAAYSLATTFQSKGDMTKAISYLKEAISRETAREKRSRYELRLSHMYLKMKDNKLSAEYAKKAIMSDPRSTLSHLILAQAYSIAIANNEVSCEGFEKKASFWLVMKVLEEARALAQPGSSEIKDIHALMATVKANFPSMEDIFFMENMKVGDPYTVNCGWISGATKVYDPK